MPAHTAECAACPYRPSRAAAIHHRRPHYFPPDSIVSPEHPPLRGEPLPEIVSLLSPASLPTTQAAVVFLLWYVIVLDRDRLSNSTEKAPCAEAMRRDGVQDPPTLI